MKEGQPLLMASSRGSLPRSDRDLVLAFQAGDKSAYDELYLRHKDRVASVCRRYLRNGGDAEEAVQETFLKAFQALPRFNGQYQVGAWLGRIASNVCVDHLRGKSRTHLVALPDDDVLVLRDKSPEDLLIGEYPKIDETIGTIQPLHADALKLRALDGLSHIEMAGKLQMTPAQVKALLHRARISFRRAWDKAGGWLLAPVIKLRSLDRSEMSQTTSNFAILSAQAPALAEKAAASVLIVMVALTGAPAEETTTPNIGASISESRTDIPNRLALGVDKPAIEVDGAAKADTTEPTAVDLVTALPDTVTSTIEGKEKITDEEESPDPTGGGTQIVPSSVKQTPKKAKETAVGVLDKVKPEAPLAPTNPSL